MRIYYVVDTYYVGYVCVYLLTSLCSVLMLEYGNKGTHVVKERQTLKDLSTQIYI